VCSSNGRRTAGAFLLQLAEAAAEALRLAECRALRLELPQARLELSHVRTAPAVLALVEVALALGEQLLARGDRIRMIGELAPRAEKRLLGRAKLVEPGVDLCEADGVGIGRDPLALVGIAFARKASAWACVMRPAFTAASSSFFSSATSADTRPSTDLPFVFATSASDLPDASCVPSSASVMPR
jgi:hypothetical protein